MNQTVEFAQRAPFTRHGGAYDRGSADAWYGRQPEPHYYTGDTYASTRIDAVDMSTEEIEAYMTGYRETPFGQKQWD